MHRWRWPLVFSAAVLLGQLLHRQPLFDVVTGEVPEGIRLSYPFAHVVLAPLTLLADWLNGGRRSDLYGFLGWTTLPWAVWLTAATIRRRRLPATAPRAPRTVGRALGLAAIVLAAPVFVAWVAYAPRPMPSLEAPAGAIIFDAHSHTARSHDGRPGFGHAAAAEWHRRAGFHAAFITDHNAFGAARAWRGDAPQVGRLPRLLDGEELSLHGLHLLVLGARDSIDNRGWDQTWDSTLAQVRALAGTRGEGRGASAHAVPRASPLTSQPLLIASLPEFWRYHWGPDMGALLAAGVGGFEVWTSSPKGMEFPPTARAVLVAQSLSRGLVLVGATDMHGLGQTASVWNVAPLAGWERLDDTALTDSLLALMRRRAHRVVAINRWIPETRLDAAIATPVGLALVLRQASRAHGLAMLGWIWVIAVVLTVRVGSRE